VASPGTPIWIGKRFPASRIAWYDGRRLEAELGRQVELRVTSLGEGVLPGQGLGQSQVGNVGAALRMAGKSDARYSIGIEKACLQELHGALEFADRCVERTAESDHFADTDLALKSLQRFFQVLLACDRAGGEMGCRIKTFILQALGGLDRVGEIRPGQEGNRYGGAGSKMLPIIRDLECRAWCRLDGKVAKERDDLLLLYGKRVIGGGGSFRSRQRHSFSGLRPATAGHQRDQALVRIVGFQALGGGIGLRFQVVAAIKRVGTSPL